MLLISGFRISMDFCTLREPSIVKTCHSFGVSDVKKDKRDEAKGEEKTAV